MQANLIWTHNFFDATTNQVQVVSPGLVVMEGDSCAKGCEFESSTGHWKRLKVEEKEAADGPFS